MKDLEGAAAGQTETGRNVLSARAQRPSMGRPNIEALCDMLIEARRHPLGITGIMLANETKAGRRTVQPGATEPFDFPADDWHSPCVVSVDGGEVRLVAILAASPGNGALRRLVGNIQAAGFRPVIVEPVGIVMPAILNHWKWRRKVRGSGFETFEEWRPRTTPVSELIGEGEAERILNNGEPGR